MEYMKLERDVSINSDKGEGHGVNCINSVFSPQLEKHE